MRTLSKHLFVALLGTAIISSCSRPVAYFQPTAREQFKSAQPVAVAATTPIETSQTPVTETPASVATPVPAEQLAQTKQAMSQVEAYVRNDSKLASSKKLTKRMARLNDLLTNTSNKATVTTNVASAKKSTLMERMMLKKVDKKIKNHVAPDQTKVMDSNIRLGIIIGIIGLLLLILSNGGVLAVIGGIGLIVGLVLILLGVINA
jgi:membrane-bound ClpP family serine protease